MATTINAAQPSSALLDVVVSSSTPVSPLNTVKGRMVISTPFNALGESCFYLPYNDPKVRTYVASQTYLTALSSSDKHEDPKELTKSSVSFSNQGDTVTEVAPYLYKIQRIRNQPIAIDFHSSLLLNDAARDDVIFDGFHPILLEECPQVDAATSTYKKAFLSIKGTLNIAAEGWIPINPMQQPIDQGHPAHQPNLQKWVIGATRNYHVKSIMVEDLPVEIRYKSEAFLNLIPTIKNGLASHISWLGTFPFPSLFVIETSNLQPSDLPGIITLNKPRQKIFDALQTSVLNWDHWTTITLLAHQWYGTAIAPESYDDIWFFRGMTDFLTLKTLKNHQIRDNFFNSYEMEYTPASMDFLQVQDLSAAFLQTQAPFAVLTDKDLVTAQKLTQQHPLLFTRHAITMRYLESLGGSVPFQHFVKSFTRRHLFSNISPKMFLTALGALPSPFSDQKRNLLYQTGREWWTSNEWPDLALQGFTAKKLPDNSWLAETTVYNKTKTLNLYPFVLVEDIDGKKSLTQIHVGPGEKVVATTVTTNKPETTTIDPFHSFFDANRFDNNNKPAKIRFFPGSARTLADDEYTGIWFPYLLRRPGENLSGGIYTNIYRYTEKPVAIAIERDLTAKTFGGRFYATHKLDNMPASLDLSANQNFLGYRESEVMLNVKSSYLKKHSAHTRAGLRDRRTVGVANSLSGTVVAGINLRLWDRESGNLWFDGETERSLYNPDSSVYTRNRVIFKLNTSLLEPLRFSSILYGGYIYSKGDLNDNVLFNPENLGESHLRIDSSNVPLSSQLISASNNLTIPFKFALPSNLLILNNQLQFLIFYDYGKSTTPAKDMEALGAGLVMPFGGDFIGAGTLAVMKFSLEGVFYSRVADKRDTAPRLLFDLMGEL